MACLLAGTELHDKLLMHAHWWRFDTCLLTQSLHQYAARMHVQHCSDMNADRDV